MKQKVFFAVIVCGLVALAAQATASAQMPDTAIRVSIPFDFNVRGKVLPHGEYLIKRVSDQPDVLEIQNVSRHENDKAVFSTEAFSVRHVPGKGEIIFHKYGDEYFLSRILAGGEQTGREGAQAPAGVKSHQRDLLSRHGSEFPNRARGALTGPSVGIRHRRHGRIGARTQTPFRRWPG